MDGESIVIRWASTYSEVAQGRTIRYLPPIARDRQIKEEQDALYDESLRADRERDRRRADEDKAEVTSEAAVEGLRRRGNRTPPLPSEAEVAKQLSALGVEPPEGSDGVCTVVIRMPGGKRCSRRFHVDHPVQALYDVIEAHGFLRKEYVLCTAYPRKPLDRPTDSLAQAELTGNVVLHCDPRIFF